MPLVRWALIFRLLPVEESTMTASPPDADPSRRLRVEMQKIFGWSSSR
jgi:hypothetical protein